MKFKVTIALTDGSRLVVEEASMIESSGKGLRIIAADGGCAKINEGCWLWWRKEGPGEVEA